MKRVCALLLICASAAGAAMQAVEFPYAQFPRQLWERELVWLKNSGITEISVPESPDSALREAFGALLRRVNLKVSKPSENWTRVSALAANNVALSREAMVNGKFGVIWTDVETTVLPEYKAGAVSLAGEDVGGVNGLRRSARIEQFWTPLLTNVEKRLKLQPSPAGLTASQLTGHDASAVVLINSTARAWSGQLKVGIPSMAKSLQLPPLKIPAGDSLWLPLDVPLAAGAFCKQCSAFGNADRLVYSTLELTALEFENGTLAMEFYAPVEGEAVLQIAKHPTGPYLAGGRLKSFDWDEAAGRAKVVIPAGKAPLFRTRVALAIEAPEQSAFFVNAKRLMIGETNRILTSYSSEELAHRSRLKLPHGWNAVAKVISPLEIEYAVHVPSTEVHGDRVEFAIEADGVEMSRERIPLLMPVSVRFPEGILRHFSKDQSLAVSPGLVPVEAPAGRTVTMRVRNASAEIRTYQLAMNAPGLEFSPAQQEVVVGALAEREVTVRVFANDAPPGVIRGSLNLTGASTLVQPVQFIAIPRGHTVRYEAQLDGVGAPQFVIESAKVRAVFTQMQGGRWLELVWKESGKNVLVGRSVAVGNVEIELQDNVLSLSGTHLDAGIEQYSDVATRVTAEGSTTKFTLTRPLK
jgi:hypothetical protein